MIALHSAVNGKLSVQAQTLTHWFQLEQDRLPMAAEHQRVPLVHRRGGRGRRWLWLVGVLRPPPNCSRSDIDALLNPLQGHPTAKALGFESPGWSLRLRAVHDPAARSARILGP